MASITVPSKCPEKNLVRQISISSVWESAIPLPLPFLLRPFWRESLLFLQRVKRLKKAFHVSHCLRVGDWLLQAPERQGQRAGHCWRMSMDKEEGPGNLHTGWVLRSMLVCGAWLHPAGVRAHHCLIEALCVFVWDMKGCSLPSHKQMRFSSSLCNSVTIPTSSFPCGGESSLISLVFNALPAARGREKAAAWSLGTPFCCSNTHRLLFRSESRGINLCTSRELQAQGRAC